MLSNDQITGNCGARWVGTKPIVYYHILPSKYGIINSFFLIGQGVRR